MAGRPKAGEIWVARIVDDMRMMNGKEQIKIKSRPVLILSDGIQIAEIDVNAAKITSNSARNQFDIAIEDWETAGLDKPSVIRISKQTHFHYTFCTKYIGELAPKDKLKVAETLKAFNDSVESEWLP